jgi:hypothetical protein
MQSLDKSLLKGWGITQGIVHLVRSTRPWVQSPVLGKKKKKHHPHLTEAFHNTVCPQLTTTGLYLAEEGEREQWWGSNPVSQAC